MSEKTKNAIDRYLPHAITILSFVLVAVWQTGQFKAKFEAGQEYDTLRFESIEREIRYLRERVDGSSGGNHNNNRININGDDEPPPEPGTWVSTARYAAAHGITKDGAYYRKDNGLAKTKTLDNGRLVFLFEGLDYAKIRHKLGTNSAE